MPVQPEADVAAQTDTTRRLILSLGLLVVFGGEVHADDEDDYEPEELPRYVLRDARVRFEYFNQRGRGFQSQASAERGVPGSERVDVYRPVISLGVDRGDDVHHTVLISVDVVTSASTDALDAISRASYTNEAGTLDVTTEVNNIEDLDLRYRYGLHFEEPFGSGFFGFGLTRWFAQRNAAISVDLSNIFDWFDGIEPNGQDPGRVNRQTFSFNLSGTQILSQTTLAGVGYGVTLQRGTLEQTWNIVPRACADDAASCPFIVEELPGTRIRNAFSGWLAQRVPALGSTLRLRYRYYRDDFGIRAHTARVELFQDIGRHVRVRGHYRIHSQDAADFFTTELATDDIDGPRTADSDLSEFIAQEGGVGASISWPSRRNPLTQFELELSYLGYRRDNGLRVHVANVGWGVRR